MLTGNEQSIRKPLIDILIIGMAFIVFTTYGTTVMPTLKNVIFTYSSAIGESLNPFETDNQKTHRPPNRLYLQSGAPPLIDYAFSKGMQLSMAVMISGLSTSAKLTPQNIVDITGDPKNIGLLGCKLTPAPPGWDACYINQMKQPTITPHTGAGAAYLVRVKSTSATEHCNRQFNVNIKPTEYNKSPGFWSLLTSTVTDKPKAIAQFFALAFIGFIVLFCAATWALSAGIMYLTNYIRGILLLLLAPIFFIFFFFKKTRDMTQKWAQNLISIMLLNIILVACISVFVYIMDVTMIYINIGKNCDISPFSSGLMAALMFLLLASMTKNIPVIVQELTGSSGQSGQDIPGSALGFGAKAITSVGATIGGIKWARDLATEKIPGMVNKVSNTDNPQGKMSKP